MNVHFAKGRVVHSTVVRGLTRCGIPLGIDYSETDAPVDCRRCA